MKNLRSLILVLVIMLQACSGNAENMIANVSAVWTENGQNFVEFRLDGPDPHMSQGMLMMPGAKITMPISDIKVDQQNQEVHFKASGKNNTLEVTLRKITQQDGSFTLLYRMNNLNGLTANLYYVRDRL